MTPDRRRLAFMMGHPSREIEAEARHQREAEAFVCPHCGTDSRSADDERLGWCVVCHELTGLCGAGRAIYFRPGTPDAPAWDLPCTEAGAQPWRIAMPGPEAVAVLLCEAHAKEAASAPWFDGRAAPSGH